MVGGSGKGRRYRRTRQKKMAESNLRSRLVVIVILEDHEDYVAPGLRAVELWKLCAHRPDAASIGSKIRPTGSLQLLELYVCRQNCTLLPTN
jgi:hypothetical protein